MAYQPKSYRKFLATSVTAAMVATVAAPVIPSVSANTSFSDVASNHWAADAINYLVEKGAIEGYPNGTFQPNASITRAEAAKILAITLGLDVDESASTNFSDASNHWASSYIAALQSQASGVIDGYTDGTFRPNRTITRQEMAKMIVTAYDLQEDETVNIDFTDNTGWGAEYITTLASLGIVEGVRAGQFQPNGNVTRAQTPVFVHRAEVPDVRIDVGGVTPVEFDIAGVEALTEEGRFAEVTFTAPASGTITRNDVNVSNARTGERIGIQEVDLSNDRRVLTVTFFENDIDRAILERGETYRFAVTVAGETYVYNFERPQYAEVRITDVDAEEGVLTFSSTSDRYPGPGSTNGNRVVNGTLEVGEEEIDLEYLLGRDVRVWYNTQDEIQNVEVKEETVYYDAVNVLTDDNELELIEEDDELEFAENARIRVNGNLLGTNADITDIPADFYGYAKLVTDSRGRIVHANLVSWTGNLVVGSIDDTEVFGVDDYAEVDLEDYVIVKDGETISIDDIEEGDAIFFNDNLPSNSVYDGYAEVYTNTVTGEIDDIFADGVEIDGVIYDFPTGNENNAWEVFYVDEDGEVESFTELSASAREDILEQYQDAGEVTLYLDRAGDLVFITGDLGELELTKLGSILLDDMIAYTSARQRIEVQVLKENGEVGTYDFSYESLDDVIINGVTYDVDKTTLIDTNTNGSTTGKIVVDGTSVEVDLAQSGDIIKLHFDDNDNVEKLEFFEAGASDFGATLLDGDFDIEDDTFMNGHRVRNNTIVFDADGEDLDDLSASDVDIYTWSDYKKETNAEIILDRGAVVYYDDANNVTYLVITETDVDADADTPAVLTEVRTNAAGDKITSITAYVNGKEERFRVDEVDVEKVDGEEDEWKEGEAVLLAFNDNNVVTEIEAPQQATGLNVTNVRSANRTIEAGGNTYELTRDGGQIIDARDSDYDTLTFSELNSLVTNNDNVIVDVVYEYNASSRFAQYFVVRDTRENNSSLSATINSIGDVTSDDDDVEVTFTVANVDETANLNFNIVDGSNTVVGTNPVSVTANTTASTTIGFYEGVTLTEGEDYTVTVTIGNRTLASQGFTIDAP